GLIEQNSPTNEGATPKEPAGKQSSSGAANQAEREKAGAKAADTAKKKAIIPAVPETKPAAAPTSETKSGPAPEKKTERAPSSGRPTPVDEKKSSYQANPSKSVFRLTAFEKQANEKDGAKSGPSAAKPVPTTEKPAGKSTATLPAAASSGEKPVASPSPAVPSAKKSPAATTSTPPTGEKSAAPQKPVQYQPLSEVKDEIRRTLAESKATDQLKKLSEDVQLQLESAFSHYNDQLAGVTANEKPPEPSKSLTDLESIAKKDALKYGRTGAKSVLELRDLPVGKTYVLDSSQPLLSVLFATHELDKYQPVRTVDVVSKDLFVAMKMSDTPERVPELSEVRAEVVRAWKNEQAEQLAKKHAEELAKKAQESKQPLTKFFADNKDVKVVRTDPFSELTGGEVSPVTNQVQPLRISQPDGLIAIGPEFLQRVFELKSGEVAVIMNHDNSIAYIVRIVEHQMPLQELHTAYLAEANSWLGENALAQMHRAELATSLESDVISRANLQWNRAPDKKGLEEGGEG
ncbi:MAG TPA: hypothetical protein VFW73_02920, partial [Lacipirellulaceae bacterium]|nr:hypothetical protein [Lacipirellulaceae bacterium]